MLEPFNRRGFLAERRDVQIGARPISRSDVILDLWSAAAGVAWFPLVSALWCPFALSLIVHICWLLACCWISEYETPLLQDVQGRVTRRTQARSSSHSGNYQSPRTSYRSSAKGYPSSCAASLPVRAYICCCYLRRALAASPTPWYISVRRGVRGGGEGRMGQGRQSRDA